MDLASKGPNEVRVMETEKRERERERERERRRDCLLWVFEGVAIEQKNKQAEIDIERKRRIKQNKR